MEVKVLVCSPKAVVVLEASNRLSPEALAVLEKDFPEIRFLVLSDGVKLAGIIEQKEGEDGSN